MGGRADREGAARRRSRRASPTGARTYPDFDQVLTEADTLGLQVSAVMQEAIAESPQAADLVYFLATHPEECTQLAEESQQTPVAAATVMRRLLESRLWPRVLPASNGSGAAARAAVEYREAPRHAGGELACRVRRAAGRDGVCGRARAVLEPAAEGPRHPLTPPPLRSRARHDRRAAMANTFITPTWVLKDVARVAVNMLKFAANIERWYDDKFKAGGAKVGYTVSGRLPQRFRTTKGQAFQAQPINDQTVPVTLTDQANIGDVAGRPPTRRWSSRTYARALRQPGRRAARQHDRLRRPDAHDADGLAVGRHAGHDADLARATYMTGAARG